MAGCASNVIRVRIRSVPSGNRTPFPIAWCCFPGRTFIKTTRTIYSANIKMVRPNQSLSNEVTRGLLRCASLDMMIYYTFGLTGDMRMANV
jgi:hypothetical protein